MTVFPRWMNGDVISKDRYISVFVWLNVGLIMFEVGLFRQSSTAFAGLGVFIFGWLQGIYVLYQSFKNSPAQNKRYESVLLLALTAGVSGVACYSWWLYTDNWLFLELSFSIGLWLYLLPVLFTVSHRMLPFFSSNVIKPYVIFQPGLSLWIFLTGCIAHFSLQQLHSEEWLFLADIPLAIIALLHTIKWQIFKSFEDRLLAVLHMAFFWLFIGMTLFSIQSLVLQFSGEYILNKAPLHAISIGFFTSMLIGMASRVTMGHSGRMLHLDKLSWYLFIGIQLAAASRVLAEIQFHNLLENYSFNLISSLLWLCCMGIWFIKYAPIYLSRRIDGKDG